MLKVDAYWDLRSTVPERHTGVGKHVIEVIQGLHASGKVDLRVLLAKDQQSLWEKQAHLFGGDMIATTTLPFSNKMGRLLAGLGFSPELNLLTKGRDLIYSPMELLLVSKRIPFVNTIHGIPCFESSLPVSSYRSRTYRMERIKQRYFFKCCRRHCRRSFVVSNYLRQQLVERFNWNEKQLHSVYNGAEAPFFKVVADVFAKDPSLQRMRLLQVGGANAFDGASQLLQVACYLESHYPEAEIAIAGDRHESPWAENLKAMSNVVWLGFLESAQLLDEMHRSTALLYVPAVESFGIIGVEAMAAGLPVLATRSTALPEVLGDAACWINPDDEASIEKGLREVCTNPEIRATHVEAGRKQAARYTWPAVVERVLSGFQQIAATI